MNIFLRILIAAAVFAVLAYVLSVVLTAFSRKFAVKKDERVTMLLDVLPKADCSGCGYGSCMGYVNALLCNNAPVNKCPVGGNDVADTLSELLDRPFEPVNRKRAFVMCSGVNSLVQFKYNYRGLNDCISVAMLGNGSKECPYGCIGLGTCVASCPFKAIKIKDGVAVVEYDKCRGCGICEDVCPQNIIKLLPFNTDTWIGCSCEDKSAVQRNYCKIGCIGCGVCEKACPEKAISVVSNLARIDYSKCTNCGICAEKCPRGVIHFEGESLKTGGESSSPEKIPADIGVL